MAERQTHSTQNRATERSWEFESPSRDQRARGPPAAETVEGQAQTCQGGHAPCPRRPPRSAGGYRAKVRSTSAPTDAHAARSSSSTRTPARRSAGSSPAEAGPTFARRSRSSGRTSTPASASSRAGRRRWPPTSSSGSRPCASGPPVDLAGARPLRPGPHPPGTRRQSPPSAHPDRASRVALTGARGWRARRLGSSPSPPPTTSSRLRTAPHRSPEWDAHWASGGCAVRIFQVSISNEKVQTPIM